jgi:DNA-binding transcriptional MerR regulator
MQGDELTVSATECVRLTGISRERLRTWERRHGFPVPARAAAGRRRYQLADVAAMISVRRAVDGGVSVADAIERVRDSAGGGPDASALAAGLDEAPLPTIVVAGPRPLTVVYANRTARNRQETPEAGAAIEGDLADQLARAFASAGPLQFDRPSWSEGGVPVPCVAAPIDGGNAAPLVALYDIETAGAQDDRATTVAARSELERARDDLAERDTALDVADEVAGALRVNTGVEAIVASLDVVLRRLGAVDGALAPYMAGQVVVGRSVRGLLGPEMLTVAAHPGLAHAVREGEIASLHPAAAAGLELPENMGALVVPATCAGEPLAVLLLVFDGTPVVGSGALRALALLGTAFGLALMQERLLTDEPGGGR